MKSFVPLCVCFLVLAGCNSVPRLVEGLRHENSGTRARSAFKLYRAYHRHPGEVLKSVPALTEALNDEAVGVRRAAFMALREIGPPAESAVPALMAIFESGDEEMRWLALGCLTRMRLDVGSVPLLIKALKDRSCNVVREAAWGLGRIGPGAREAVPALVNALGNSHFLVRKAAAHGLEGIGPEAKAAAPALVAALGDEDERVRIAAAGALLGIQARDETAVRGLVAVLRLKGQYPRVTAAKALALLGPKAKDAVPDLMVALRDTDCFVREAAALALGAIGADARAAIPALVETMDNDGLGEARHAAVLALEGIGEEALPPLGSALEHDDFGIRLRAVDALGLLGPAGVEPLVAVTRDSHMAKFAAEVLGRMGPTARPANARLKEMLAHEDPAVRIAAAEALFRIGEEERGLAALSEAVNGSDHDAAWFSVTALGGIGPKAEGALPTLRDALKHEKPKVRASAAVALVRIGEDSSGVAILIGDMNAEDPWVRKGAAHALEYIGPKAEAAIPALVEALGDKCDWVSRPAIQALWKIGEGAVPALGEALKHESRSVRRTAAEILANIGPEAKAAVPALTEALLDGDGRVRELAAWALKCIVASGGGRPRSRGFVHLGHTR